MDNLIPPTPPEARQITPDCQPVFPCWLWSDDRAHIPSERNRWFYFNLDPIKYDGAWFWYTHWHPDQPTPPTQPPAPLAGGTEILPSTATTEVAAGCKEGRPVSPATVWVPIVVCAALRKEGKLVIGIRHYDPLMRATISATFGSDWWKGAEQGFVNAKGQFLTRQEAHVIAKQNNQIRHRCGGDEHELYSENLY